ncbi:MAG: winged helix-turn-helix domain-containing protein [Gammaproteobacteria bacterium]
MGAVVGRLLLVSDAHNHVDACKRLRERGWLTHLARDMRTALQLWSDGAYDTVILALHAPGQARRLMDALTTVRPFASQRPALYVVGAQPARQDEPVPRPGVRWLPATTTVDELIRALSQRNSRIQGGPLQRIGVLELDLVRRCAYLKGLPVPLRAMEFALLLVLVEHAGSWVSLERVANTLGCGGVAPGRTLAVHLCRLRAALGDRPRPRVIQSRRRHGYRLNPTALGTAMPASEHCQER